MSIYTPTWLCIKQHNQTGLKYLCKTTRKNPIKYAGSGRYWKRHLQKHGNDITTLWCHLYLEKEILVEEALAFSRAHNIVKAKHKNGKKIWANEKPENGLDGNSPGAKLAETTKKKIGKKAKERMANLEYRHKTQQAALEGRLSRSDEEKRKTSLKMITSRTGLVKPKSAIVKALTTRANWSNEEKENCSKNIANSLKDKPKSEKHKLALCKPKRRYVCPVCSKEGPLGHMKRFHTSCGIIVS